MLCGHLSLKLMQSKNLTRQSSHVPGFTKRKVGTLWCGAGGAPRRPEIEKQNLRNLRWGSHSWVEAFSKFKALFGIDASAF